MREGFVNHKKNVWIRELTATRRMAMARGLLARLSGGSSQPYRVQFTHLFGLFGIYRNTLEDVRTDWQNQWATYLRRILSRIQCAFFCDRLHGSFHCILFPAAPSAAREISHSPCLHGFGNFHRFVKNACLRRYAIHSDEAHHWWFSVSIWVTHQQIQQISASVLPLLPDFQ